MRIVEFCYLVHVDLSSCLASLSLTLFQHFLHIKIILFVLQNFICLFVAGQIEKLWLQNKHKLWQRLTILSNSYCLAYLFKSLTPEGPTIHWSHDIFMCLNHFISSLLSIPSLTSMNRNYNLPFFLNFLPFYYLLYFFVEPRDCLIKLSNTRSLPSTGEQSLPWPSHHTDFSHLLLVSGGSLCWSTWSYFALGHLLFHAPQPLTHILSSVLKPPSPSLFSALILLPILLKKKISRQDPIQAFSLY